MAQIGFCNRFVCANLSQSCVIKVCWDFERRLVVFNKNNFSVGL